tara:strand:- start:213 stop:458 length:246 start_codon:yes stop_codon:yes gene_type:complete
MLQPFFMPKERIPKMRNKYILSVYAMFAYALANIVVGFYTLSHANTVVFAHMQPYDAIVCMISAIFIVFGMMIIGIVVMKY